MDKKEDLNQVMERVDRNTHAITAINLRMTNIEGQISAASSRNEDRIQGLETRISSNSSNPSTTDRSLREAVYDKARRSFRVWPIKGNNPSKLENKFRDFATEALQISSESVQATRFSDIIRTRNPPSGRVYLEICVTFESVEERDYYNSKARNLADYRDDEGRPEAGIQMDVPPFLMSTFKTLNDHGHEIRNVHGKETRRYVKFDEERLSLVLEVQLPLYTKWISISPEQACSFAEERGQADYSAIRRLLLRKKMDPVIANDNPNLIPLGSQPSTSRLELASVGSRLLSDDQRLLTHSEDSQAPGASSSSRKRWAPPHREANRHT